MTLRTKLWLTALLLLVVCLILSYILLLTSRRVHEARESEQFANSVMQQMLELNRVTHAYLQRHSAPGRMRWQAQHQVFSKLLTTAKPRTMETRALIGKLLQNRQRLSPLILPHALPASASPSDLSKGSRAWQEGANGQLHTTLQAMLADAYQLMQHSYQSLAVRQQQMRRLTLGLSIAIFSIIAWACWFVRGHLVAALAQLREAERRLEKDLQQFQKMQSIGTLASGIAHEFNNILAAMLGYTELTQNDLPRQSPAWHNLQAVRTAGMRAKELVRQILAFSRQQPMERQPVPYGPLVKEVLSLLRVSLPKTIDIHQHIDCDAGYIIADRTQMHQIIMNLCSNAEHAMRQTGGVLEIQVDTTEVDEMFAAQHSPLRPGPHIRLSIRDSGYGIPAEVLERIFDPFFTTKDVGEGTGMGLAIVYGIVSSHDGAITVESTVGVGTAFTIYLPCIAAPAEIKTHDVETPVPRGKGRILLVDDEAMLTRVAENMLTRLGYEVESVLSPSQAIIAFQAAPDRFDLIITDQTMPQMTGVQLATALRQLRPNIPVILCTGFSETMDAEQAYALGINAFLMKPLELRELGSATHDVLAQQAKAA